MACGSMWMQDHVRIYCPIYCPSRGPITHQMAHVRLFGRVPPRRRCNTVWEVTPRSRARTCQRPRSSVRSVCVCVWSLHPGRRARSLTGADQHQALYSRLCERGRLPDSLPGRVRVANPRQRRPGPGCAKAPPPSPVAIPIANYSLYPGRGRGASRRGSPP